MKVANVESGSGELDIRAVVVTADKFEDMELFVPCFRLLEDGAHFDIAASSMDDITGEHGYTVAPDVPGRSSTRTSPWRRSATAPGCASPPIWSAAAA